MVKGGSIKRQKEDPKWQKMLSLTPYLIIGNSYHMIMVLIHICKVIIFPAFFSFFSKFWFILFLGSVTDWNWYRVIFCSFKLLLLSKMQNIRNLKQWKKCWKNYQFTHVYQKPQSYEVLILRYRVRDRTCYNFGPFLHFYPLTTQKIKILKK